MVKATPKLLLACISLYTLVVSPFYALGDTGVTRTDGLVAIAAAAPDSAKLKISEDTPPDDKKASITPGAIERGTTVPIRITFVKCKEAWKDGTVVFDDTSVTLLLNNGIQFLSLQKIIAPKDDANCTAFGEILVSKATLADKYKVKIGIKKSGDQEIVESFQDLIIEITGAAIPPPGPIPTDKAEVDVMWAVVPKEIAKDNFGPLIAKRFYCLEVVIGNNSGYSLQVAAVGFKPALVGPYATAMAAANDNFANQMKTRVEVAAVALKAAIEECNNSKSASNPYAKCISERSREILDKLDNENASDLAVVERQAAMSKRASQLAYSATIPVSSYPMARGTASHGEFWQFRNITVSLLRALGPILTGITPFLDVANQRNYANAANLFTNPITKGFESFMPDETVSRLQRLDDQILRDGMVIANNTQVRTRTLIPKELLKIDKKHLNDPVVITQALGELVLIGDLIRFVNRVNITSAASGEVAPPPTVDPTFQREFSLGSKGTLSLTGTGLNGATVTSTDPKIVIGPSQSSKTSVTATIEVLPDADLSDHTLVVTTPRGSVKLLITVSQGLPIVPDNPTYASASTPAPNNDQKPTADRSVPEEFKMTIQGENLLGASLERIEDNNNLLTIKPNSTDSSDDKKLTAIVTISKETRAGTYKFRVVNRSALSKQLGATVNITVDPPPDPVFDTVTGSPAVSPTGAEFELTVKGKNLNKITIQKQNTTDPVSITITSQDDENIKGKIIIPAALRVSAGGQDFIFDVVNKSDKQKKAILTIHVSPQPTIVVNTPSDEKTVGKKFQLTGDNMEGIDVETATQDWEVEFDKTTSTKKSIDITIKTKAGTTPTIPTNGIEVIFKNTSPGGGSTKIKLKPPAAPPGP